MLKNHPSLPMLLPILLAVISTIAGYKVIAETFLLIPLVITLLSLMVPVILKHAIGLKLSLTSYWWAFGIGITGYMAGLVYRYPFLEEYGYVPGGCFYISAGACIAATGVLAWDTYKALCIKYHETYGNNSR